MMKTEHVRPQDVTRDWHMVNATGVPLGRLCTLVARVLMGKHKPQYSPHVDGGDHVIVINASQLVLTGNKAEDKHWFHHSGYQGGTRFDTYKDLLAKTPEKLVRKAVIGMLPKNKLGHLMQKRLMIYAGGEHPHVAQKPKMLEVR